MLHVIIVYLVKIEILNYLCSRVVKALYDYILFHVNRIGIRLKLLS
jgi:hypothetical protein